MSPFSLTLRDLRMRYGVRQADLADKLGYEQSYISAIETGLKGPPTNEFIERLIQVLPMSLAEQKQLRTAVEASERKLVLDPSAPLDIYWLLRDLRESVNDLSPGQVRAIREILNLSDTTMESRHEPIGRIKRRKKEEVKM